MKKIIAVLFSIIAVATLSFVPVLANTSNTVTVSGSLKVTTNFSKDEKIKAKKWFDSTINRAKGQLTQKLATAPQNEVDKIKTALKDLELESANKRFVDKPDETAILETKLPDLEVNVGGVSAKADKEGKFTLVGVQEGRQTLTLSYNGSVIRTLDVNITSNQALDVNINNSFTNSNNLGDNPGNKVKATDTLITSPQYPIGTKIWRGSNSMTIVANGNIVSCNKAGNTLDSLADFPYNNSDCAQAIVQGTLYASNPITYWYFSQSYNCYIEALIAKGELSGSNPYCNGTKKSDGYYNCSHFFPMYDSDVLHTEW